MLFVGHSQGRGHVKENAARVAVWAGNLLLKQLVLLPLNLAVLYAYVDDIALVLQQNRLRWYGHVLRKDDDDWVKKCMEHQDEGPRPRGRPKKTWKEVVREDCQARKLNKEDAMDRCKWRKMIKEARWFGSVWVGEGSFWYRPTRVVPDQRPLNGRCVVVVFSEITWTWNKIK